MKVLTTIEFKNHYIYVRRLENADLDEIKDTWRRVAAECEAHNCYNILVESFVGKVPIEDTLPSGQVMGNAGIDHRHRIAWVHHEKESLEDLQTALKKQGIANDRLFPDIEEALKWLLITKD